MTFPITLIQIASFPVECRYVESKPTDEFTGQPFRSILYGSRDEALDAWSERRAVLR